MSASPEPAVELSGVGKILCRSTALAGYYALQEMAVPRFLRRRRGLRPGEFEALSGVSFAVRRGETAAVLGPPKSGKTILAEVLGGLRRPDRGTVRIRGRAALINHPTKGFKPMFTLGENLAFKAVLWGVARTRLRQACARALDFAGLTGEERTRAGDLEPEAL
ncbi:MAG: ATP-binding cassette domain-containing protein, partial [Thermoanaerobaculia bacterium]